MIQIIIFHKINNLFLFNIILKIYSKLFLYMQMKIHILTYI